MERRVVVTGMGVVSPLGVGTEAHWASVTSSASAVRRLGRLSTFTFPVDFGAEVPSDTLEGHLASLPRKQLKLYNRATRLGMLAASFAMDDAGLKESPPDPSAFGIFLGTLFTAYDLSLFLKDLAGAESWTSNAVDLGKLNAYCMTSVSPLNFALKVLPNLAAGHMAIAFDARGFCRTLADGCTGGLQAIGQAFSAIRRGELDVALCGGTEAPLEEPILADLCAMGLLAEKVDEPSKACRPFDARRSGIVLGEGAGLLVLEEQERAFQRGARIYGEVVGFGASAGEASLEGVREGLRRAMEIALEEARDGAVDYIQANGDSTAVHDRAEAEAIREVFGPAADSIPISATKSMHGHLISASGPVELLTCLLALKHGIIPAIINYEVPDPFCDLSSVANSPRPKPGMRMAVVNAIGFFGESVSLVVRRPDG